VQWLHVLEPALRLIPQIANKFARNDSKKISEGLICRSRVSVQYCSNQETEIHRIRSVLVFSVPNEFYNTPPVNKVVKISCMDILNVCCYSSICHHILVRTNLKIDIDKYFLINRPRWVNQQHFFWDIYVRSTFKILSSCSSSSSSNRNCNSRSEWY
jgi:hypothetical protein